MNSFSFNNNSYVPPESKMSQEQSDKRPNSTRTNIISDVQDNLIPENSGSYGGGNNLLKPHNQSDSMGLGLALHKSEKEPEVLVKMAHMSSFNNGFAEIDENKLEQDLHHKDEEIQTSIKRRQEKLKSDAQSYAEKPEEEKEKYMTDYKEYFAQLHDIVSLPIQDQAALTTLVEAIVPNSIDFLANWGPKRCLMYLKLASLYSKMGSDQKVQMLSKAEEDLSEMTDAGDISECRRWLYLQRIESRMNNDTQKTGLTEEGILLKRCWNVSNGDFAGRRDFLDFYTIFLAKHLLRLGEYKTAERAYDDALTLRKLRRKYWKEDDFDWDRLEKEVKLELQENEKAKYH